MPRRLLLLLLALAFLAGCFPAANAPTSTNTPEEMFAATIANPLPAGIRGLQGVGDTWQGYQLFLRFRAPGDTRAELLVPYEEIPCAEALPFFVLPHPDYDRFTPSWSPESVPEPRCYRQREVQNEWTHAGEHFILVDGATGAIYFVGIGA